MTGVQTCALPIFLARALCATKKMLLLDEPVTGLDPLVTAEFYQLIKEVNQRSGIAVVMVSHDIESAVRDASHILHLQETALFYGKAEEYRESLVGRMFLERTKTPGEMACGSQEPAGNAEITGGGMPAYTETSEKRGTDFD